MASSDDPISAGGAVSAGGAAPVGATEPPAEPTPMRPAPRAAGPGTGMPHRAPRPRGIWTALAAVYAVALGAGLGLWSADRATRGDPPFGGLSAPPWTAWPRAGSRAADPYARAITVRRGDIPLAAGEGVVLTAATDDEGRPLESACDYRVAGDTPPARAWTLTVYDGAGRPVRSEAMRAGFTSAEILREVDGRFAVAASREARPGNWLPLPDEGRFGLALRLYDSPVSAGTGALDRRSVPSVRREACRP